MYKQYVLSFIKIIELQFLYTVEARIKYQLALEFHH